MENEDPRQNLVGRTLLRYRIEEKVGEGGWVSFIATVTIA